MSTDPVRVQTRLTKESGPKISGAASSLKIGGPFTVTPTPPFVSARVAVYDRIMANQKQQIEALAAQETPIRITLPDGATKDGIAWQTTPLDVALAISQSLADQVVVARVTYHGKPEDPFSVATADVDGNEASDKAAPDSCCSAVAGSSSELWDVFRPLLGDCRLELLKFDDHDGRMVFWHSSAHILGESLETLKGAHLTIGPPIEGGFYYDSYMGTHTVLESDLSVIEKACQKVVKDKQKFERIVLTKEEALEMFADNVFKTQIIATKIPDGAKTTAYRCGPLIDLCRGPHVPHTGKIKALAVTRSSSSYWLGKTSSDVLQRVYGISFPDKNKMKEWKYLQAEAAKRDHRRLGMSEELFFFHSLSPGSGFWLPHGSAIYFKLLKFIREQYRERGYTEVITPNIFNMELWNISGHAQHYKENMFVFDVEGQEYALKPMNCPAASLMFDFRQRSYRELPIRLADCGVLHRNEMSGALTGLTRVRRFQQDDAHIFCRDDQIKKEVLDFLTFMKYVYDVFGIEFKLELSTRPEKAMGELEQWERAEKQLAEALDEFVGTGKWVVNPGDGAFYGPKIDIMITDALKRQHQCATVQLDFQLPIRFNLKYRTDDAENFKRPVIIHRAIYGSLERFVAVLVEHYAGKFPFWLSPRQILIVTVGAAFIDYGYEVKDVLFRAGFDVDIDDTGKTLNKKIREGQMAHYNSILVVGAQEQEARSVNIRTRDNKVRGTKTLEEAIAMFKNLEATKAADE
uniref:Probable threonine--tRNA ligase, cytoplasmic n=1 Tax=Peronospora matthiolae TaxID=2874970 RepID=A0AAV1VIP7_9STRA